MLAMLEDQYHPSSSHQNNLNSVVTNLHHDLRSQLSDKCVLNLNMYSVIFNYRNRIVDI